MFPETYVVRNPTNPNDSGELLSLHYQQLTSCLWLLLSYYQGVTEVLCEACSQLGWKSPTKIQIEAIPVALQGE